MVELAALSRRLRFGNIVQRREREHQSETCHKFFASWPWPLGRVSLLGPDSTYPSVRCYRLLAFAYDRNWPVNISKLLRRVKGLESERPCSVTDLAPRPAIGHEVAQRPINRPPFPAPSPYPAPS